MTFIISMRWVAIVSLISISGCFASPPSVTANRCYLVQGNRERYLEVDTLARSMAAEFGLHFTGRSPGALEINGRLDDGKIVISSPSGSDASIIAFFNSAADDRDLSSYVDLLLTRIEALGMVTKSCAEVPGLSVPIIYGDVRR